MKTTRPLFGVLNIALALAGRASASSILPLLLLLALPAVVQAQFGYTITNGTITITGYEGSGGAVAIPSTIDGLPVTSIGAYAFRNGFSWFGVTSVTIPDSVTNIGEGAFWSCSALAAITVEAPNSFYSSLDGVLFDKTLTTLIAYPEAKAGTAYTIPSSVASIGDGAFEDCYNLTSITIPHSVTSIGYDAFYSCTSVTSLAIPNTVTSIGDGAFGACSSLTSVTIPDSVTSIGTNVFCGCHSLAAITVDAANSVYSSLDGVLFDKSQTTLIAYPQGKAATSYTIPSSVTSIGDSAFSNCSWLTSVTIGNGVTSIGDSAFTSCASLTKVTIGNSVTSIGCYAFYSCASLTSVAIPNTVTNIGDGAFGACSSLTSVTIPNSVLTMGNAAFWMCASLASVTIGTNVSSVMANAFGGCYRLASVTIPNSVTNIGDNAFGACGKLTSVTIPNSVISIGSEAFDGSGLTSITIPSSVTSIGGGAFACSVTAITVDALNSAYSSLDGVLFNKNQTSLIEYPAGKAATYRIPDGVTSIGDWAFFGCSSLTSVAIPNSLTNIGVGAFEYCYSLTSVYFQGNAPSVGSSAFFGDGNVTAYYLPGTTGWGATFAGLPTALWNGGSFGALQVSISPPSVVSAGAQWQVDGGPWQNSGTIVSNLLAGSHTVAFSTVTGWAAPASQTVTVSANQTTTTAATYVEAVSGFTYTTNNGTITITGYRGPGGGAVTVPSTINGLPVTSIESYAFWDGFSFLSVTSVTIPDSVTNIGQCAFWSCSTLAAITVDALNSFYSSLDGVLFDKSQTTLIAYPEGKAGTSYTIPSSVTSIGQEAFGYCWRLTSVAIPNSVTGIGAGAFDDCYNVQSMTIPDSVASIGDNAFAGTYLSSATIPDSVTNIGEHAFWSCPVLTAITVDPLNSFYSSLDGVLFDKSQATLIAYPDAKAGASYTIPSSVTSIGDSAFSNCSWLTSVTIGNGVTSIGDEAFYGCGSLTSVTIPDSVTSIADYAFVECYSLTNVTIGNGVTSIADSAFESCSSLTSVYFKGNAPSPTNDSSVFSGDNNATVYYLAGTTGWGATFDGRPAVLWNPPVQGYTYTTTNGAVTITGYTGPGGPVVIPSVVDGLPVTSIGYKAFAWCASLTSVTIPNSVTSIGGWAFDACISLTNIMIPNSVTSIGNGAFMACPSLTSVTIPNSVTSIGDEAFYCCSNLTGVYFQGNAPSVGSEVFGGDNKATVYYLAGTTGWGATFGGRPTRLWENALPPSILTPPSTQTAEMGSLAFFSVDVTNTPPGGTYYQWFFSGTTALASATNSYLDLANVQLSQAGAYTVVVTNLFGAVTSDTATLSVIPPVERRVVPALNLTGDVGSFLHLDYVNGLGPGAQWLSLSNFTLTSTSQLCFDLSEPLPAQRFYRAWQTNAPSARPVLDPRLATEIPLTGAIGSSVRVDYINAIGPTDAWVTLDTVLLTNTTQFYFDVTMFRQPTRLYRLVALP